MPSIDSLLLDVYKLQSKTGWFEGDIKKEWEKESSERLAGHYSEYKRTGKPRLSKLGPHCPREYWYSLHRPELAEDLPPHAKFKYAYGHMIEALALTCARAAGHTVEGQQDELECDGVFGHRDVVIDGVLVDVKSAASRSFEKFKDKSIAFNDDFGYLAQLDGYLVGSSNDPIVKDKRTAYLWAIDKQLGHMVLYEHRLREEFIKERIQWAKNICALDTPPACTCSTEPDGESGNIQLSTRASYNQFKWECFPTLRCFLYSGGPRYLTKVVRTPKNKWGPITEVDRHGNVINWQ